MANNAPVSASSMMSPVRLENSTLTPLAWVIGSAAATISWSARMIRPRPMNTRPSLAEAGLFAAEEENHAEEDQQWRKPRQVEGQHPRHQRGADIGAEHDRQGRRQCHQALGDEGGGQQGGGVAALHQGGDADAGGERQRAFFHAATEDAPQVGAVDPEDSGADDMRAPHQQGDGREQVEQFQHGVAPLALRRMANLAPGSACVAPRSPDNGANGHDGKAAFRRVVTRTSYLDRRPRGSSSRQPERQGAYPSFKRARRETARIFSPSVRCMRLRHRPWN